MFSSDQSSQWDNHKKPSPTTSWKCINTIPLPTSSAPLVYRNETISYACLNMIRTWNWKTNEEKSRFVPVEKEDRITALTEIQSSNLVLGTEKGYIYVEKNLSWVKSEVGDPVSEIIVIGPNHIIIRFENTEKCLVNITNGIKLIQFKPECEICPFRENVFASLQSGCVEIKSVDNFLKPNFSLKDPRLVAMRVEKDKFLLLQHKDRDKFTIWDVEKGLLWEAPLNPSIDSDQFQTLVLIDSKTFIVPGHCQNGAYIEKFAFEHGQWSSIDRSITDGEGKVTSMIFTDDFVIYMTKASSSGIHVFDADLCFSFWSEEFTNGGRSKPLTLKALDGFVAIKSEESICIIKRKQYKKRLFVGEGDFSFTEAFIKKHEKLAGEITASEIKTRDGVEREFRDNPKQTLRLMERLIGLEEKGVEILYEIDARCLHKHFPSRRFKRIHWNCPFGEYVDAMSDGGFKDVILDFFDSCSKVQCTGDRMHITLMQERYYRNVRQKQIPIVLGSATSGYRLIKKRFFGRERYPGYEHMKSGGLAHHSSDDREMREFVFEKVGFDKDLPIGKTHRIKYNPTQSNQTEKHDLTEYYFECSTDEDSSDYEETSDDDKVNKTKTNSFSNGRGFQNSRTNNNSFESNFAKSVYVTNSKFYKKNT